MVRDTAYDEVRDAQRHFRLLLDAMARPGSVRTLAHDTLGAAPALNRAAACLALSLLNADTTFHLSADFTADDAEWLRINTGARPAVATEAAFVFLAGIGREALVAAAHGGTALYPETGATLVIQVDALSAEPFPGGLELALCGPGVPPATGRSCFVRGLSPTTLAALQTKNAEFPLGVDTFLGDDAGRVVGLARTTALRIGSA